MDLNKQEGSYRISELQLEHIYNIVQYRELDVSEIKDYCKDEKLLADYQRTAGSLWFGLIRMHILVHGIIPFNLTYNAELFQVPETMHIFCHKHGYEIYETYENVCRAEKEALSRPKKIKREAAVTLMSQYYTKNRNTLPKTIKKYREQIITKIMSGHDVELSFVVQ